jgi:SAM-dependent methyltransferase
MIWPTFLRRQREKKATSDWVATEGEQNLWGRFCDRMRDTPNLSILELGTKRVAGTPSTVRRKYAHRSSTYIASDFQEGEDVDEIADVHELTRVFGENRFDMVLACSVYEHIMRPWIATAEIAKAMKPGGWFFIQTHHTFPIHGYPNDYFRFSREALEMLCIDAGLTVIGSAFQFPAQIVTEHLPPLRNMPAFLNSQILAAKA